MPAWADTSWKPPLNEWRDIMDDLSRLDWSSRFKAEMEMDDGTIITGELSCVDEIVTDDGDYPEFAITDADGKEHYLGGERYRRIE